MRRRLCVIIGRGIAISALREADGPTGAGKSVAVHMIGQSETTVQMVAISFLLFDARRSVCRSRLWGEVLIFIAAVLTIWFMAYYIHKAMPEIRSRMFNECNERIAAPGCGACPLRSC
jgi:CDP-diacylglycerol--glycerol-3-phosphate 3-phosphatidyltransferase